jgi:NADPH:quinone reductase-like Zn-dependent oxidoreductase
MISSPLLKKIMALCSQVIQCRYTTFQDSGYATKVAGLNQNQWPVCSRIGGRIKSDSVAGLRQITQIDYTKDDFTKNEQKYDLIFDVKTNRSVFDYQRVLSPNGIYVTVGGKTSRILQVVFLGKLSKKHKMHMVIYKANKDLNYLIELFKENKLKPVIDKCFSLEKTPEAFRYFGEGRFKGKIVVTLGKNKT